MRFVCIESSILYCPISAHLVTSFLEKTFSGRCSSGPILRVLYVHLRNHVLRIHIYGAILRIVFSCFCLFFLCSVTDVWVDGRQLMKDRVLLTLNQESIVRKAHMWRRRISTFRESRLTKEAAAREGKLHKA